MILFKWSKYIGLLSVVVFLSGAVFSRPATASDPVFVGGQICQPMNLDIALKGLQWRSEGALNNFNDNLWVVCPTIVGTFDTRMDVAVRLINFGNSSATVQCLFKVTDLLGATVRSNSRSLLMTSNWSDAIFMENVLLANSPSNAEVLSVSCKLPPETGILFIGYGSI